MRVPSPPRSFSTKSAPPASRRSGPRGSGGGGVGEADRNGGFPPAGMGAERRGRVAVGPNLGREKKGVLVGVGAGGTAVLPADIAKRVEHGEGVAMLQDAGARL